MNAGTYRGRAQGLTFDFRVECDENDKPRTISGDIYKSRSKFVASFLCNHPDTTDDRTVRGPIVFRGNPELFTGQLSLSVDSRGIGSFEIAVDLQGGYRDLFAGRVDWQGSFLRRLTIEVDGISGSAPPTTYASRRGLEVSIQRAFEDCDLDVDFVVDPFRARRSERNRTRGYTQAELHAAMTRHRGPLPADRLHAHVFVASYLAGRGNRDVLGIMYDYGRSDLNRRPREGVAVFYDHPMLSDPRVPEADRNREYVYTLVHEIGHALNLLHSFDKARPAALSWMNYPDMYPRGYEAGAGHDGTDEFWRRFEERFDKEELDYLHRASPREIQAGGFAFGKYEEGWSSVFEGPAEPRRTRIGANPLRSTDAVSLTIAALKDEYDLGEPAFIRVEAANAGSEPVHIPDALDPSEGFLRLHIQTPRGETILYQPPVRLCKQAQRVHVPPREALPAFEGVPLFLASGGPILIEPGSYRIVAELAGVDGTRNVTSLPAVLRVRVPDRRVEAFAEALWERPDALEALYVRHPLVAVDQWDDVEAEIQRARLPADNTTASYFNYVAALGWMTPFAPPAAGQEQAARLDKAIERMGRVDPRGLPTSVERRKDAVESQKAEVARRRIAPVRGAISTRPEETARTEVPPSGLFGPLGLERAAKARPHPTDPFARVVPSLRGTTRFADVVSWNIEHLHSPSNWNKIPKIAELIRSFRCDFWGLQEVDEPSLEKLLETINSSGRTKYAFVVVPGKGQQSGALFRTDTTRVQIIEPPAGAFGQTLQVPLRGPGGKKVKRSVFHRPPLLCEVQVRQKGGGSFDFRCAIVHLKSTDQKLKDTGNSLRKAAAKTLATWIGNDMEEAGEVDYLVLGDMNAETAEQGLRSFAKENDLRLLSVGMQDRYGKAEALTRVASQRLLDHIVVTGDSFTKMPKVDEDEQLIVRSDTRLVDWTEAFSDHVPVAVRFILGDEE